MANGYTHTEYKIGGGWAREASGKMWDPLFISATD